MSELKKNQHFVPQFYLRRFSPDGKIIYVFDKVRRRSWRKGIAKVASEDWFYETGAIPPASNADQVVENSLGMEEGVINGELTKILEEADASGKVDFSPIERRIIVTRFVALQFVRTRLFRDTITNAMQGLAQSINEHSEVVYEHHKSKGIDVEKPERIEPDAISPAEQAEYMYGSDVMNRLMNIFFAHVWTIHKVPECEQFMTSDAPVSYFWHGPSHPLLGTGGMTARGIEMALPLSSKYLLSMKERTYFASFASDEGWVFQAPFNILTFYNNLQTFNSKQYILAQADNFASCHHCMDQNPECANPDRSRTSIRQ